MTVKLGDYERVRLTVALLNRAVNLMRGLDEARVHDAAALAQNHISAAKDELKWLAQVIEEEGGKP